MAPERDDTMWLHAQAQISIVELAETTGLPEDVLRELVECGVLLPAGSSAPEWAFGSECVASVRRAARLCNDLELESSALAVVLSLLERIERLEAEARHLRAQLFAPRR